MSAPLLEIQGLTHLYGPEKQGIKDISFSIAKGEFMLLAGGNGSGKTTLIRHLNGLLKPDRGKVLLHGKNIYKDIEFTRKTIGMVFQDAETQIVGETVFDEVAFGPENLGLDRKAITQKVNRALETFNLLDFSHRHPATLSGGEKKRLTIAGILVMDPQIILFDEPFANLDYPGTCDLVQRITTLHQSGKTILMATHDLDLVIDHADQMLIMEKGQISAQGPAQTLAADLGRFGLKPQCTCKRQIRDAAPF
ncbi:MAG: ABC transporter ATP-binding protein [Desulfobacter sp.]|nr:ABC transporter ATP-binding protein [Desulfobacter sp.]WDP85504.1 MAG: ABC transporter ATP-binding protein [Desulfobacter sp.]